MSQTSGLTVRQHEREGIEVPIEFVVSQAHGSQVCFSPSSTAVSTQAIRGRAIDISSGGIGLQCRQFLPRMCEGVVRVFAPVSSLSQSEDTSTMELMFEHTVKVRRVTLIGREPLYSLGVAFVNPSPTLEQHITALFNRMQSSDQPLQSIKAGGINA